MRGIAFYGKGGIGKSTILSNVTAALSKNGEKLLQIGCDPKHDSTRLILGGFTQSTVLEQLNTAGHVSLDSVMLTGCDGIKCIESGGPEPGVGCAGRGIIQMLNLLREQGLDLKQFDYVFFDVLGDVVCGGFAVPMREGYADEVYIVTSGEIASIYAANNIAKGLKRFSSAHGKLGGVIGNGRGTRNERDVVALFSHLIGTEMVAFIPRSRLIAQAEFDSKTIMDFAPDSKLATIFKSIANHIELQQTPVVPKPLSDKQLDNFLRQIRDNSRPNCKPCLSLAQFEDIQLVQTEKGFNSAGAQKPFAEACKPASSAAKQRDPVQGCSLAGAYAAVRRIKDSITIMHAPQGCAYVSFSGHINNDAFLPIENRFPPNLLCTNLQEKDVIFGGIEKLKNTILKFHKRLPSYTIFVITSCPAGIIGDDVAQAVKESRGAGIDVYYIPTEGVMNDGDFYMGMLNAYHVVAESLIDNQVAAEDNLVNIIGQPTTYPLGNGKHDALNDIFEKLNIKVNCRFASDTTVAKIRTFKKAKVSIPFSHDPLVRDLTSFLKARFSIEILEAPLPLGFEQTAEFARALGRRFDKLSEAEELVNQARADYERRLVPLRKFFSGKKTLIFSSPHNIDWLITTLFDLNVEIGKIYCSSLFRPRESFSNRYVNKVNVEDNYALENFGQDLEAEQPDFVLTAGNVNAFNSLPCDVLPTIALPFHPAYGFNGGLDYANGLYLKLKFPSVEGWRNDKELFECG